MFGLIFRIFITLWSRAQSAQIQRSFRSVLKLLKRFNIEIFVTSSILCPKLCIKKNWEKLRRGEIPLYKYPKMTCSSQGNTFLAFYICQFLPPMCSRNQEIFLFHLKNLISFYIDVVSKASKYHHLFLTINQHLLCMYLSFLLLGILLLLLAW